jgi:transposase
VKEDYGKKNMVGECRLCRDGNNNPLRVDCCGRKIISLQPDFLAQRSALVEVIEDSGHVCIFFPKFHCELNFIERYWGAAKRYARNNCNYTWSGLQETVPRALDSVDLITIRRFARKTWRYMDLYRHGVTGKFAKKYISHRRECILEELRIKNKLNKNAVLIIFQSILLDKCHVIYYEQSVWFLDDLYHSAS